MTKLVTNSSESPINRLELPICVISLKCKYGNFCELQTVATFKATKRIICGKLFIFVFKSETLFYRFKSGDHELQTRYIEKHFMNYFITTFKKWGLDQMGVIYYELLDGRYRAQLMELSKAVKVNKLVLWLVSTDEGSFRRGVFQKYDRTL